MSAPAHPHADPASYRAVVHPPGTRRIEVIDQRALPHVNTTIRIAILPPGPRGGKEQRTHEGLRRGWAKSWGG